MGKKWSEERKRKHSESVKAYWTDDRRKAKSEAMQDFWTDDRKAAKSEVMTGEGNHMHGSTRTLSDESRAKISNSLKGYKHSEETKRKIGAAHTGMKRSTETRRKISEAKQGTVTSDETKKLLSIRGIERYEDPEERRKTGEASHRAWKNPKTRKALMAAVNDPHNIAKRVQGIKNFRLLRYDEFLRARKQQSETLLVRLEDPDYYEQRYGSEFKVRMSEQAKEQWADPDIRNRMEESLRKAWQKPNREDRIARFIEVATSFKHCKSGHHHSPKAGKVHYRSSYELAFFQQLDAEPEVSTYEVETLQIPYKFEGKKRTYIPDVLIHYVDGTQEIVEIKPEALLDTPENDAKLEAAFKQYGYQFVIVTEQELFQ